MIRKAVIPAAGYGRRLMPLTRAQPKEMLPVVHKPIIHYVVEEAYEAGIKEILIITGRHKRAIEDYFDKALVESNDPWSKELEYMLEDIDIFFTRQREPRGLADAIRYAKAFVDNEPFALLLGDNITLPPCTKTLVDIYKDLKATIIALEKVSKDRISKHGIIKPIKKLEILGHDVYRISKLVEKPKPEEAPSDLAIIGRYILTPEIFDYIKNLKPGYGGELQLTDALNNMAKDGIEIYGVLYKGKRYDIGDKKEWLKANIELSEELLGSALDL